MVPAMHSVIAIAGFLPLVGGTAVSQKTISKTGDCVGLWSSLKRRIAEFSNSFSVPELKGRRHQAHSHP